MQESTTSALVCRDCELPLPPRGRYGRQATRCQPCRVAADRVGAKARKKRAKAGIQPELLRVACADCLTEVLGIRPGYRPASRCKPCTKIFLRKYRAGHSKRQKAKTSLRAIGAQETVTCDCGATFTQTVKRGRACRRCENCVAVRNYAMKISRNRFRRAMKRDVRSEPYLTLDILTRDGWKCHLCRKRIGKSFEFPHPRSASIDHLIPLSRGGDDVIANVAAAHLGCNVVKNNRGGGEQLALL